jgi:hypothetical protein
MRPVLLGHSGSGPRVFNDPTAYADWCWRKARDLPSGQRGGIDSYSDLLAGKQVKGTLGPLVDMAYTISGLQTSDL